MVLQDCIPNLGAEVIKEIEAYSVLKTFAVGECVVKQGEFIRFLPMVVTGNVKVFSNERSTQFLLYFIPAGETCIFSFAHLFEGSPAEFSAIAEAPSELMLLPIHKVREWFERYPRFSHMLLQAHQRHYRDLLHTTKQVICYNLEERLLQYLKTKTELSGTDIVERSHQQIADDLGTSREVVTRLMKKLGGNEQVEQIGRKIKVH